MTTAWAFLAALFLLLEGCALVSPRRGDTLSEHVWALLRIRWLRGLAWLFWAWLTVHFFAPELLRLHP